MRCGLRTCRRVVRRERCATCRVATRQISHSGAPSPYGPNPVTARNARGRDTLRTEINVVVPKKPSAEVGAARVVAAVSETETAEGDVMLIAEAGAYGAVMASRYNLREPAGEAVI